MHFTVTVMNHVDGMYSIGAKPVPRLKVQIEGEDWSAINSQVEKLRKVIAEEPKKTKPSFWGTRYNA